jgi:hypothetical protein
MESNQFQRISFSQICPRGGAAGRRNKTFSVPKWDFLSAAWERAFTE